MTKTSVTHAPGRTATVTLLSAKCAECGHEARNYESRATGELVFMPVEIPADIARKMSRTSKCRVCGAIGTALLALGAAS